MDELRLRPLLPDHMELVNRWVTTDELALQFGGPLLQRPITYGGLVHGKEDEVAFVVERQGESEPLGTAQLRGINTEAKSCRIACVLLFDPDRRGMGLGAALIGALLNYAQTQLGCTTVTLFVIAANSSAIACYQRCGFSFTGGKSPVEGGGVEMRWNQDGV